VGGMIGVKS